MSSLKLVQEDLVFTRAPLLLPSLFFLLGLGFAFSFHLVLVLPLLFLLIPCRRSYKRIAALLVILGIGFAYGTFSSYHLPKETPIEETFLFSVSHIKEKRTHYKTSYIAKGSLHSLASDVYLPITLRLPKGHSPGKTANYLLKGGISLEEDHFHFEGSWEELPYSWSLVPWRFAKKKMLRGWIHKRYKDPLVANFFTAISLGELSDPLLRFSFNTLGLQHILAISGFHFALFAFLFGSSLHFLFPRKLALSLLAFLLTGYFLLLGPSSSIIRAYIGIMLYLLGQILGRKSNPLNLLGASLLLELLLFPASLLEIGFQLSFLATGAILILLPMTNAWIAKHLPIRSKKEVQSFPWLAKGAYLLSSFVRGSLSLNIAIYLVMIPTCLFHFGVFPLGGLLYNLVIPPLISATFFLFFFSIPFAFITKAVEVFTREVLRLVVEAPSCFAKNITLSLSEPLFFLLIFAAFTLPFVYGRTISGEALLKSTY